MSIHPINNSNLHFGNLIPTFSKEQQIAQLLSKYKINMNDHDTVNTVNEKGNTALILASHKGNLNDVQKLLEYGTNVNMTGEANWTALAAAVANGQLETAKLLIEHGADTNICDDKNFSALMFATADLSNKGNSIDIIRLLLKHGAKIDASNYKGQTALNFAIGHDKSDIVQLLLDQGANPNTFDENGMTPLMQAVADQHNTDNTDIVPILLKGGALPNTHNFVCNRTALMAAAILGDEKMVKLLLDNGADINAVDVEGDTALILAAHGSKEESRLHIGPSELKRLNTIQLLIQSGADIDALNNFNHTALTVARFLPDSMIHRRIEILLLQNGASDTSIYFKIVAKKVTGLFSAIFSN